MKLKQRYCTHCGAGNPLLAVRVPRRRAEAVKSAGSGYAPVVPLRPPAPQGDPRWADILRDPDPAGRDRLLKTYFPDFTDGGAA